MTTFMFRSEKDPRQMAFTSDRTGSNLPADFDPGKAAGSQVVPAGSEVSGSVPADVILAAVEADGYIVVEVEHIAGGRQFQKND
jgi:hypothetical protein